MDNQNRHSAILLGAVALIGTVALCVLLQKSNISRTGSEAQKINRVVDTQDDSNSNLKSGKIVILYGTTTGTGKSFDLKLLRKLIAANRVVEVCSMSEYDQEKLVKEDIVLVICSTWMNGEPPVSCQGFMVELKDYAYDFRVSKNLLEKVHFSVFGLGAELYGNNYGKAVCSLIFHNLIFRSLIVIMLPLLTGDGY